MKTDSNAVNKEIEVIKANNSTQESLSTSDRVKIGIALVLVVTLGVLIGMYGESF